MLSDTEQDTLWRSIPEEIQDKINLLYTKFFNQASDLKNISAISKIELLQSLYGRDNLSIIEDMEETKPHVDVYKILKDGIGEVFYCPMFGKVRAVSTIGFDQIILEALDNPLHKITVNKEGKLVGCKASMPIIYPSEDLYNKLSYEDAWIAYINRNPYFLLVSCSISKCNDNYYQGSLAIPFSDKNDAAVAADIVLNSFTNYRNYESNN